MGFSSFWGTGICYRGEALAMLGQVQEGMAQMREGIAGLQSLGVRFYLSGRLYYLAGAQAKAGQSEEGAASLPFYIRRTGHTRRDARSGGTDGRALLGGGAVPAEGRAAAGAG